MNKLIRKILKLAVRIDKLFAFESPTHAMKFITPTQLDLLNRNGFNLEKVKAKR